MSSDRRAVASRAVRGVTLGTVALAFVLSGMFLVAPPEPSGVIGLVVCTIGLGAALDWFAATTRLSSWLWEKEVDHWWLSRLLVPRGAAAVRLIGLAVAFVGVALMRDIAVPLGRPAAGFPAVFGVGGHLVAAAAVVGLIVTLYACLVVAREHARTKYLDGTVQRAVSRNARS